MKTLLYIILAFGIGAVAEHMIDRNKTCEALDGQQKHTISNPFDYKHAT